MTYAWEQLEGVSLAGEYGLDQWLGSDASGAFFLTSFGRERQRAVLKLVVEDPSTAGAQLAVWQRAERLVHPSLMALLDCGRTDYGGDSFLFAVFEAPDDSLTAAIQNGPLSEDEARDVLVAALGALQYLHARGWAHTSIDTEHVVAVGDRIKLASDTLWDGAENQQAQCDDVRALGALIYELVTARRIGPNESPDLSGISDPLRTIIEHSVEADARYRWTAVEIADALNRGVPDAPPVDREPVEQSPAEEPVAAESVAEAEITPVAKPSPVHEPAVAAAILPPSYHSAPPPVTRSGLVRYVPLAAVAAVALIAIAFVATHHSTPPPNAVAIAPPPVAAAPAQPQAIPAGVPASAPKQPGQSWRVIAFTFARQLDAEKKAKSINTRFAGIHAEVFPVGSSYLISLGAHLTRENAASLQRKAIGKGLPRDTYIQNFRIDE